MHASQLPESTLTSCGIDWVTTTTKPGRRAAIVTAKADRWITNRSRDGYIRRARNWQGYQGVATDGVGYGVRGDGVLCTLSGEIARLRAPSLLGYVDNVSRLDVQITTHTPPPFESWRNHVVSGALTQPMIQAGHLTLREITTYRGGETIYIGSRNSERMFRVYDKHAESKGLYPTGTWRWEIEYKGARALSLALRLRATDFSTASIMDAIVGAFMTVGVRTPVGTVPQNFRDSAPIEPTNDQKRLEWLSVQVKPSIERLLDHMDPLQVLDALGLANYYPPQMEGEEEVK